MEVLLQNFHYITLPMVIMWAIGGVLIYLAIAKEMEPTLLLPMGFGAILVNLPVAVEGTGVQHVLETLFSIGIEGAELFPLMLFIGIGAMNVKRMRLGQDVNGKCSDIFVFGNNGIIHKADTDPGSTKALIATKLLMGTVLEKSFNS